MSDHLTRRRRKEIKSLGRKRKRDQLGEMLVEGVRAVESAVAAGAPLVEVVVSEAVRDDPRVAAVLDQVDVPVYVISERDVNRLADTQTSQGVLAVVRTELFPEERLTTLRTVLALDGVQDPGNVGTLVRTAAWFGADVVLAGSGTAGFFNPKVVRAAAGSLWDLHLARTADLAAVLERLSEADVACYGADMEGTSSSVWSSRRPSVLVMGSEAHGLSADVRTWIDERVSIPGAPRRQGAESLNVAVAAGILIYEWLGA